MECVPFEVTRPPSMGARVSITHTGEEDDEAGDPENHLGWTPQQIQKILL